MAEEKKGDKKAGDKKAPAPAGFSPLELTIAAVVFLFVVGAIVERLYRFTATGDLTFFGISLTGAKAGFSDSLPTIKIISYVLSIIFAFGAVVFSQLRNTVLAVERKKLGLDPEPSTISSEPIEERNPMAEKWKQVMAHSESEHPSDWRLAIIECDIMLSDLLDTLNLPGDTMGDKLKAVEKSDFITLDLAWEAHKVRNQIAHAGSEFLFNQREARRVVDLYAQVFREFRLI